MPVIENKIPIILDTDPGIDDAVAIAAAIFHPQIDLRLITTVAGNVSVDKTTSNTLKLLHFWDKDIPVARGASQPLVRSFRDASHVHGHSGMDGYEFELPEKKPMPLHAVEAMREEIRKSKESITLVPIGPLTNIALLFSMYPEAKKNIKQIVMMGGSASRGNRTPNAEFNIFADPEAAKVVFSSGLKIVMCGLDVTNKATISPEMLEKLLTMNKTTQMFYSLFLHYRSTGFEVGLRMHDLCAIAYLVNPQLFTTHHTFVDVEIHGEYTFGTTVADLENVLNKPANTHVCIDIDVDRFRDWTMEIFSQIAP